MKPLLFLVLFTSLFIDLFPQNTAVDKLINDSTMVHASVSICVIDPVTGHVVTEHDSQRSLIPASIMKLITTAVALELLGPDYTFRTSVGYRGTIDKTSKTLYGDIIIKGGGDPCLGSEYFNVFYGDFITEWSSEIKRMGINKIDGRVITDDSFYNYEPVPSKWLWEDIGNYYGAGVYGLSIFDNYYSVHLKTATAGLIPEIIQITPELAGPKITNFLLSGGVRDEGYLFVSPYSDNGWVSGTVPVNREDFVLKGSIADPPLLAAKLLNERLRFSGVEISGEPSTGRVQNETYKYDIKIITETVSPPLSEIINILNHESINLYAESLTKQLGLVFRKEGSTESGIEVIKDFLDRSGIETDGMNSINAIVLGKLLLYMKTNGKYFSQYLESFPEAAKPGTLKNYFTGPVFENRLRIKTGSMSGVRSYAGYVKTNSGKEMIVAIIVNNYSGSSEKVVSGVEDIIKSIIIEN
jgi:D-alanyl-D-alanine carboxypeptidase/D-alanyl-D-alanine-endopeptidase (penicillin-binding protein 4)